MWSYVNWPLIWINMAENGNDLAVFSESRPNQIKKKEVNTLAADTSSQSDRRT
jgi:hypothetical protein